jgi:hypothetical protein
MFEELLARLGSALDKHSIPYMIIGGQAVLLYGEPRLTRDIDTVYIRRWLEQFDLLSEDSGGKRYTTIFEEILGR